MSDDLPDRDELPALVDALQKKCNRLAGENQDLRERVERLEELVRDPSEKEYAEMDKGEKVRVLRARLADIARNRGGVHAMHYDDVIDVFHGHPSPGHAYDLMEQAAAADGFDYGESPGGQKRLTVETDGINPSADFHAVNNGIREEAI